MSTPAASGMADRRSTKCLGLELPRSTDRRERRFLRSSLTASSSHGAGGSTSSSACRNSIFSARSLSTVLLHALPQFVHASLNPALHGMDAGAGYGCDLFDRQV